MLPNGNQAVINERASSISSRVDSHTGKVRKESGTGIAPGSDNRVTSRNERQRDSVSRSGYKNVKNSLEKLQELDNLSEERDLSS